MIRYQVRICDLLGDRPISKIVDSYDVAVAIQEQARADVIDLPTTRSINDVYINYISERSWTHGPNKQYPG